VQFIDQRSGPGLPNFSSRLGGLAAYFFFDAIEGSDASQRLGCYGRGVDGMDVVELAPRMCPACDFIDGAVAVEMMKSGIGIGLQRALEVLQVLPGMLALAIFRVGEPDGGRGVFAGRPVVAHIGPESARLRLAIARREHRDRSVVGVELGSSEHMLLKRGKQGSE